MTTSPSPASRRGGTPRALAGAGLLIALLAVSYSLVEAQGARGLVLAGAALLALGAGAVELRRQRAERRQHATLELEALESIAREAAALPAAARALEEASERVSVLEQRLAESHSEATRETLSVIRAGLLDFQSAMKLGIEDAARAAKEAVAPLVEEAVRNTVAATSASAEHLVERVGQDIDARRESEAHHFDGLTRAADQLVERLAQDAGARWESGANHFEGLTRAAEQLVERLEGHDAAEARQQERGAALLEGIERASDALQSAGQQQREALEASATASIERARELDEQAASRFESLSNLVSQGSEAQSERLERFEERLAEAQRSGAATLGETLAAATRELGESLSATGEAVRGAAELVQAGGAEMTAVAEQFGASVERQREAANQWLESLGQIEGAVDEAGRGAAAEALDSRLAATQEIFATQLDFQRELFNQLRALGERVDAVETAALPDGVDESEQVQEPELVTEGDDPEPERRSNGSGESGQAATDEEALALVDEDGSEAAVGFGLARGVVEPEAEASEEPPR